MRVTTVLGDIDADQLGTVMPHEHLIIDRYSVSKDFNLRLSEVPLAEQELHAYKVAGGATVVELTPPNIGRDPEALCQISQSTGVNIVMGCGWYHEEYYQPDNYRKSTGTLAAELITEIRDGAAGTGIRPGIIGELGTGDIISPAEERAFRAAARAQLATGLTISTHAHASYVGAEQLALLQEEGVPSERIVIGHLDSVIDPDYHESIARSGAWIQFDLIRSPHEWEIQKRLHLIGEVFKRGFAGQLLLSQDICMKSHLKAYGGIGYDWLLELFVSRLRDAGLADDDVQLLLVENPQKMLAA